MWPIAERTATTRLPSRALSTSRRATAFSFSVSPTEVPPNFATSVPALGVGASGATAGTCSNSVVVTADSVGTVRLPSPAVTTILLAAAEHHRNLPALITSTVLGVVVTCSSLLAAPAAAASAAARAR